jgi:hypothetical protein
VIGMTVWKRAKSTKGQNFGTHSSATKVIIVPFDCEQGNAPKAGDGDLTFWGIDPSEPDNAFTVDDSDDKSEATDPKTGAIALVRCSCTICAGIVLNSVCFKVLILDFFAFLAHFGWKLRILLLFLLMHAPFLGRCLTPIINRVKIGHIRPGL